MKLSWNPADPVDSYRVSMDGAFWAITTEPTIDIPPALAGHEWNVTAVYRGVDTGSCDLGVEVTIRLENGKPVVEFPTSANRRYVVERAVTLNDWTEMADLPGTGAIVAVLGGDDGFAKFRAFSKPKETI